MAGRNVIDLILNFDIRDYNRDQAKIRSEDKKTRGIVEKPMKPKVDSTSAISSLTKLAGAYLGITTAIRLVSGAVETLINFEQDLANVATLGVENMDEMRLAIQNLSKTVPKDLHDLTQGLYQVVSAGVDAANQMYVLETAALAATAGLSTTEEALNLLSAVVKGYGFAWEESGRISDLAFKTVELGQTTFGELASSIGRVIPLASTLGVEVEELFASFATLTGVTGNTAEVSTQLSSALGTFIKTTPAMNKLIKELGFDSAKAMVKSEGLVGALQMVVKSVDGDTEALSKLMPRKEALIVALTMAGSQAEIFADKMLGVAEAVDATTTAAKKQIDTVGSQWTLLMNDLGVIVTSSGDTFEWFARIVIQLAREVLQFLDVLAAFAFGWNDVVREATEFAVVAGWIDKEVKKVNKTIIEARDAVDEYNMALLRGDKAGQIYWQNEIERQAQLKREIEQANQAIVDADFKKEFDKADKIRAFYFKSGRISWQEYLAYLQSTQEEREKIYKDDEIAILRTRDAITQLKLEVGDWAPIEIIADPEDVIMKLRETFDMIKPAYAEFDEEMKSTTWSRLQDEYEAKRKFAEMNLEAARLEFGEESIEYQQAKDSQEQTDYNYEQAKRALQIAGAQHGLGLMAQFMYAFKGQNKTLFMLGKRASQAKALINTYEGVTKALGAYPPPFSAIAAAAQLALGLANVAKIEATAFDKGGLITPSSLVGIGIPSGEDGIIAVQRNEMVMNRPAVDNNYSALEYANKGGKIAPAYAEGGIVGDAPVMDFTDLIEAIENVNINIHSETDAIRYRRETEDEYISNENKRVFG